MLILDILLALLFFVMAFKPLATWQVTEGWTYKHPEANEPSEAALGINSITWFICGIVTIIGAFVLHGHQNDQADCDAATQIYEARDDATELASLEKTNEMELKVAKTVHTPSYAGAKPVTMTEYTVVKDGVEIGKATEALSSSRGFDCAKG